MNPDYTCTSAYTLELGIQLPVLIQNQFEIIVSKICPSIKIFVFHFCVITLIDLILTFENTLLDLSISRKQPLTKANFALTPPSA